MNNMQKGALRNTEATHFIPYYFDMFPMFPLRTRYNCLQQFRYAINPSRAAAHIECTAYIDRRKTDIENP